MLLFAFIFLYWLHLPEPASFLHSCDGNYYEIGFEGSDTQLKENWHLQKENDI